MNKTSNINKFYKLSVNERVNHISRWIDDEETASILEDGLTLPTADQMIENVIGIYGLPLGIATSFLINGQDHLVPMVVEEPSVVAAASHGAKLFRDGGGFQTSSDAPVMIAQVQLLDIADVEGAAFVISEAKPELIKLINEYVGSIVRRGGGAVDVETRVFSETAIGPMLVVHLLIDTRDAMGANVVNTVAEAVAPELERLSGGRAHLKILSNLTDRRKARAEGTVPADAFSRDGLNGHEVVDAIIEAAVFAEIDPYRATTHNKGVMNGIDPVIIATGNDWRAVEAGAHAFAARDGTYRSLTRWRKSAAGDLHGVLELPLSVGIVGGATRVHPLAQLSLKILGVNSAQQLAEITAAVGLAQNLTAMRALATEGIQRGHMRLHARQMAAAAGATPDQVQEVAARMIRENAIRLERAQQIVREIKEEQ